MQKVGAFVFVAALMAHQSMAGVAGEHDGRFRGRDDRVMLDSAEAPYAAIGRLNLGGGRQFCTGVLVAPDKVLTAAHCLTDSRTRRAYLPEQVHFVAGQRRNTFLDHAQARCMQFLRGSDREGRARIEHFRDDAAVVVLDRPLSVAPVDLTRPVIGETGSLSHPAYSRRRPFLLSVHDGCRVLHKASGVWLTDCDTSHGASGGPLFMRSSGKLELAAIMSGLARRKDEIVSVAVPITLWGKLVETAVCPDR